MFSFLYVFRTNYYIYPVIEQLYTHHLLCCKYSEVLNKRQDFLYSIFLVEVSIDLLYKAEIKVHVSVAEQFHFSAFCIIDVH